MIKGKTSVTTLAEKVQRGANAEVLVKQWEGLIQDRRDTYYTQLVNNTKKTGEVDQHTVMLMVALEDVMGDLGKLINAGKSADSKLKLLERTRKEAEDSE